MNMIKANLIGLGLLVLIFLLLFLVSITWEYCSQYSQGINPVIFFGAAMGATWYILPTNE